MWQRLAPDLERRGVLTTWDVDALAVLCDAVVQYPQASQLVAVESVLVEGRRDVRVKHPAMQIVRDCAQTIRAYCQEFGLTPSARSGIVMAEESDARDASRLLS